MKAFVLETAGGPESAILKDVPTPTPTAGEVRVALKAASLNHRELWISRGQYPGMQLPCTMGADGAGIVDAVGEGADTSLIGSEVVIYPALHWGTERRFPSKAFGLLGMPGPGTMAQYICVPAENVAAKPAGLSFEEAAALPTAALTAWRALTMKAGLRPGEKVLITGIGGGVATFGLKFAIAMGADVFVTSGSDETLARAKALGAKDGVNYTGEDWRKVLPKLTGGIDVVLDGAPAASFPNYVRALNSGARVVIYGSTGGPQFPVTATDLFLRHASVIGTAMGDPQDFREMLAFVQAKGIKPAIDRRFGLDAAGDALLHLQNAHQLGKVMIAI